MNTHSSDTQGRKGKAAVLKNLFQLPFINLYQEEKETGSPYLGLKKMSLELTWIFILYHIMDFLLHN